MAYSSESCMVSQEKAKQIKKLVTISKERREKMKKIFDRYQQMRREMEKAEKS